MYDSVYPDVQDTADVTIIVSRNPNSPVCSQSSYNINIAESTSLGDLLIDVNGTDADGHTLTYAITGDERALQYYYINPQNGYISLKSVLTTSSHLTDTVQFLFYIYEKSGEKKKILNDLNKQFPSALKA